MISVGEARELDAAIGAAMRGDTSGLSRAQEITAGLLNEHLPRWEWEHGHDARVSC